MPPLHDEKAARHIDHLRSFLEELSLILGDALTTGGAMGHEDHMGFMAYVFLSKQLDHAKAVLQLGDHPDAQLVARSMLEGRCQLLWADQQPERAFLWRAFGWIVDWRTMRAQGAGGMPVEAERQAQIVAQANRFGDLFRDRTRSTTDARRGDPFRRDWYPLKSVRALFAATGSMLLYERLYVPLSAWHHWSPAGVGHALSHHANAFVYDARSVTMHATALAAAFQCLYETAAVADRRLSLALGARLTEIYARYVATLDGSSPDLATH